MLDLAGVTPPTGYTFDGQSWLPLLASPNNTGVPWRTAFPLEHLQKGATANPPSYCGVRTSGYGDLAGRWKYIRYVNGETELYNMNTDPFELNNLCGEVRVRLGDVTELAALAQSLCNPPPPGYSWS